IFLYNPASTLLYTLSLHDALPICYIIATDSDANDDIGDSYVSYSVLKSLLDRGRFNKVLLALDVCYGGAFLDKVARRMRGGGDRSEEHTSELQSRGHLVCRLLLEK